MQRIVAYLIIFHLEVNINGHYLTNLNDLNACAVAFGIRFTDFKENIFNLRRNRSHFCHILHIVYFRTTRKTTLMSLYNPFFRKYKRKFLVIIFALFSNGRNVGNITYKI